MNIISQEEVINLTKDLATKYCIIRYKQEVELSNFKNSFKEEIDTCIQEIYENGLSKKNLDRHRCAYEKLVDTGDYTIPNSPVKSEQEIAEFIYSMVIRTVVESKSNTMFAYKEQYTQAYEYIIAYYKRYFEIKNHINKYKEGHRIELSKVVDEIQQEGIPLYIIKYIYKCLKNDFINKKKSPSEFNHCKMMYDLIRDELIEKLETIEAEEKIDLNKIKQVHITREEAITRISSIVNLIEEEDFETLKNHSTKDEIWFSLDYIDKYTQLLYKYKKYYHSKYGELNEWSDEKLCYVVNLPGFRFAKKEEYFIRR